MKKSLVVKVVSLLICTLFTTACSKSDMNEILRTFDTLKEAVTSGSEVVEGIADALDQVQDSVTSEDDYGNTGEFKGFPCAVFKSSKDDVNTHLAALGYNWEIPIKEIDEDTGYYTGVPMCAWPDFKVLGLLRFHGTDQGTDKSKISVAYIEICHPDVDKTMFDSLTEEHMERKNNGAVQKVINGCTAYVSHETLSDKDAIVVTLDFECPNDWRITFKAQALSKNFTFEGLESEMAQLLRPRTGNEESVDYSIPEPDPVPYLSVEADSYDEALRLANDKGFAHVMGDTKRDTKFWCLPDVEGYEFEKSSDVSVIYTNDECSIVFYSLYNDYKEHTKYTTEGDEFTKIKDFNGYEVRYAEFTNDEGESHTEIFFMFDKGEEPLCLLIYNNKGSYSSDELAKFALSLVDTQIKTTNTLK